jgi:hypothetical protein
MREMDTVQAESAGARSAKGLQKGSDSEEDSWLEEVLSGGRTSDSDEVSVARDGNKISAASGKKISAS